MAIPDFQSLMRPLLEFAADGKLQTLQAAREALAHKFKLSEADKNELLPSGRQTVFVNRVAWAKVYLHHAGLSTKRAFQNLGPRANGAFLRPRTDYYSLPGAVP